MKGEKVLDRTYGLTRNAGPQPQWQQRDPLYEFTRHPGWGQAGWSQEDGAGTVSGDVTVNAGVQLAGWFKKGEGMEEGGWRTGL